MVSRVSVAHTALMEPCIKWRKGALFDMTRVTLLSFSLVILILIGTHVPYLSVMSEMALGTDNNSERRKTIYFLGSAESDGFSFLL